MRYLCDGLHFGFDTKISRTDLPTLECRNNVSARSQPEVVNELIEKECENGFYTVRLNRPRLIITVSAR